METKNREGKENRRTKKNGEGKNLTNNEVQPETFHQNFNNGNRWKKG